MADDATVDNSTDTGCVITIHERVFDLKCLGPAIAIIVILACLKRRKNLKLEYCHGYPGLVIPIDFLGGFSNRFTIAATFGATASTCVDLFMDGKTGLFSLGGPPWLKVFQGLIAVLVYGILFYPFFACLTTDYKLLGSLLGLVYGTVRFCFKLVIELQCGSDYDDSDKKVTYLELIGILPTYFCLLFINIRFAVLLFLEIRKTWFQFFRGFNERSGESSENLLIGASAKEHVKKLLNPGLNSNVTEEKWYLRLMYFIYKPRADFKFSTQLISTLLVATLIVFQVLVTFLSKFDDYKETYTKQFCADDTCKDLFDIVFGSLEAAFSFSSLLSVILMLHFMKCHRNHVLQLYQGQKLFYQHMDVSPAKLVERSLQFSGYQVAYALAGYLVLGSCLTILTVILGFTFKHIKDIFSPATLDALKDVGLALLPTVIMAVLLWLFQLFLGHFVFRNRSFPNITITVDNRRLFSIISYFFFFYNVLLGVFSCLGRIFKGMVLGVMFLSRIDRTSLMQGFQKCDQAFVAYLGFINVLEAHSHPVMLVFCQLLISRNEDRWLEDSLPSFSSVERESLHQNGSAAEKMWILAAKRPAKTYDGYTRELRFPRLSQKAVNRWHVAVTLLRNPSLLKYRKQGLTDRIIPAVSLGSINTDVSVLWRHNNHECSN